MWIQENGKNIWITEKERFERMTKAQLVKLCLEYYNELYDQ